MPPILATHEGIDWHYKLSEIHQQYYQSIQIISMKGALVLLCLLGLLCAENNNFDYSHHGADWAALKPDSWDDCDPEDDDKLQQSPIEIAEDTAAAAPSFLFTHFFPADATVTFFNTTVYLKATSLGEIYTRTVRGDIIVMKATEMRFRAHSEHKIYGKYFDLEMQVFFQEAYSSSRNERLGLSVMLEVEEGASSGVLRAIKDLFPDYPDKTKVRLDLSEFLDNDQPFDFWYYLGSATIPPCRDGALEWIVAKKVFKMSQGERDFFWNMFNNEAMDGNYRSIQPLRGNKVDYYHFSSL